MVITLSKVAKIGKTMLYSQMMRNVVRTYFMGKTERIDQAIYVDTFFFKRSSLLKKELVSRGDMALEFNTLK